MKRTPGNTTSIKNFDWNGVTKVLPLPRKAEIALFIDSIMFYNQEPA